MKQRLRNLGRDFRGHCRQAVQYVGRHFRRYDTAAHGGEPDQRSSEIDFRQTIADQRAALNRALTEVYLAAAPNPHLNRQQALNRLLRHGSLDGEALTMEIGAAAREILDGGTRNGTVWAALDVAAHPDGRRDNVVSPADTRAFVDSDAETLCGEDGGSRTS